MSSKNIWLNPPLEKLAEECGRGNVGRGGMFSRRLGDIVERYTVLMSLVPVPELTENEKRILGAVVCGSAVSQTMIRYLHESVVDSAAGNKDALHNLSLKVEAWDFATRMAVIEAVYPR